MRSTFNNTIVTITDTHGNVVKEWLLLVNKIRVNVA
ncbi:hypothetical protein [Bacillus pumilus]